MSENLQGESPIRVLWAKAISGDITKKEVEYAYSLLESNDHDLDFIERRQIEGDLQKGLSESRR